VPSSSVQLGTTDVGRNLADWLSGIVRLDLLKQAVVLIDDAQSGVVVCTLDVRNPILDAFELGAAFRLARFVASPLAFFLPSLRTLIFLDMACRRRSRRMLFFWRFRLDVPLIVRVTGGSPFVGPIGHPSLAW